ncbi:MAG: hypothetical protein K5911_01440 [Eubacteriales bacterium]|nr:hypothetical protein [Eubacteriales bacterium]
MYIGRKTDLRLNISPIAGMVPVRILAVFTSIAAMTFDSIYITTKSIMMNVIIVGRLDRIRLSLLSSSECRVPFLTSCRISLNSCLFVLSFIAPPDQV